MAHVNISQRALTQRINRALKPENQRLRKARTEAEILNIGEYFVVDIERNTLVYTNVDLEAFGRELGTLAGWEKLE